VLLRVSRKQYHDLVSYVKTAAGTKMGTTSRFLHNPFRYFMFDVFFLHIANKVLLNEEEEGPVKKVTPSPKKLRKKNL
jgi:hypothetical protein